MQTSRQVFSPDFVYLLHAAPRAQADDIAAGGDDAEEDFDEDEESDEDTDVEEVDFDD